MLRGHGRHRGGTTTTIHHCYWRRVKTDMPWHRCGKALNSTTSRPTQSQRARAATLLVLARQASGLPVNASTEVEHCEDHAGKKQKSLADSNQNENSSTSYHKFSLTSSRICSAETKQCNIDHCHSSHATSSQQNTHEP